MTLYFYLLLFTLSFPLGASWDRRFKYAQNFKYLFPAIFITGTFFIVWDIIFTKNGVWGFSEVHASSLKFFYLPIEEWLFFIIIPFSCVFIYESVKYFHKAEKYNSIARYIFSVVFSISIADTKRENIMEIFSSASFMYKFLSFLSMAY